MSVVAVSKLRSFGLLCDLGSYANNKIQQDTLKGDINSVPMCILMCENGGGDRIKMWEWCEYGGRGSQRAEIERGVIWMLPNWTIFTNIHITLKQKFIFIQAPL